NLCFFSVGRILASVAGKNRILPGSGQDLKFVGIISPNGPRDGFHRTEVETASFKNSFIGFVHLPISFERLLFIHVKRISVLHYELTAPHKTKTGTNLIPKLGLDLIKIEGELSIRIDALSDQISDDLFVGRSHTKIPIIPILETKKLLPINLPTTAFFPKLSG